MTRLSRFLIRPVIPGAVLLIFLLMLMPLPVCAQTDIFIPYVSVKQEYSSGDIEEDEFITTGTAGLEYTHRDARMLALVDASVSQLVYWDNDQLDSTNGLGRGSWKYRVTERAGAGLKASFRKDSRRDQDLDTTGLVLSGERNQAEVSGSADYRFSEITAGEITVGYTATKVDGITQDEDDGTIQVDLSLTRNMSRIWKNTTGMLNLSYARYSSEIDSTVPGPLFNTTVFQEFDSDVFQVTAGFSRNITELYNVYLLGGANYTMTTEEQRIIQTGLLNSVINLPDKEDDNLGGVLAAGVNYDGLYYDISLGLSHDVRGGSGTNGTVERTSLTLGVDWQVSEDFFLTFGLSGHLNRNVRKTTSDLDQFTINVQPGFRYRITDTLTFSGVFRYTSVEDRQNDTTRERNQVILNIRKEFDL